MSTDALTSAIRDLVRAEVEAELDKQPDPSVPRLLSVEDAAEALGLSRATVYKELAAGRLRSVRISRRRLVSTAALADYISGLDSDENRTALG